MATKEVKCVIVGDSGVGKSYLLITYISNIFPNFYCATSIDTVNTEINFNGKLVKLSLFDTGGNTDYDRLRPMFYKEADLIVMCFSIADPDSLDNIKSNWLPEVRHHCQLKPIILVGCKLDLRNDQGTIRRLKSKRITPTTFDEGYAASLEVNALRYIECSSLNRTNLTELFDEITRIGLNPPKVFRCPCSIL